jgi:hypothetical protein
LPAGYDADPDAVEVYSNIDNSEGDLTLKRVFEPLGVEEINELQ